MTRTIVRTICLATLFVTLPAVAPAQGHRTCSNASLAGTWGYTETGTVMSPTGPVLVAAVGTYTFDHAGSFSGTQSSSTGGKVGQDTKLGTYTVNADCTATLLLSVYDESGTTLLRRSIWEIVLLENATEIRGIMTSLVVVLPVETPVPPIVTMSAKRVLPGGRGKEQNGQ
jgi:hypothetical protein